MKRKNNHAFTMIELIAAVVIMGILMLIMIPNILNVVEKNKKTTYLNDAKRLITDAKAQFKKDTTIIEPTQTLCLVFRLKDLDKTELQKGPNNGNYNTTYSYVTINYDPEQQQYTYGVQLLEEYKKNGVNNYRGIPYITEKSLQQESIQKADSSVESYTSLATLGSANSRSCPSGLVYADGSTSSGTIIGDNNTASPGDILTVIYKKGTNIKEIEKETESCTVLENQTTCTVTFPTIIPEEGYASVGWSEAVGNTTGTESGRPLVLAKNKTYYANAIDNVPPMIELSSENDLQYTQKKEVEVTIKDLASGLKEGMEIKYGWSTSQTKEPSSYQKATLTYQEKDKTTTFTATGEGYNGSYYLWIVPVNLKDVKGNVQKQKTISTGTFNYNNSNPKCVITNEKDMEVGTSTILTLTCTDEASSIEKVQLTPTDFLTSSENAKILSVSAPEEIGKGYKYSITIAANKTGNFSFTFPKNKITNQAGNKNLEDTTSKEITIKGITYTINYKKGENVEEIGKEQDSCTTTGSATTCVVTLPSITPTSGFLVGGWGLSETDASLKEVGQTITLSSNETLYAIARDDGAPKITLAENASTTYSKTKNIKVTITDEGNGIASGANIQYGWSKSNTEYPTSLEDAKLTYQEKDKEISFIATGSNITGSYYLWVIPNNLMDTAGNIQAEKVISTGTFIFDNEEPICSFSNNSTIEVGESTTVTLTCKDADVGLKEPTLTITDFVSDENFEITKVSLKNKTSEEYSYDLTVKATKTGNGTIRLLAGKVNDKLGNTNNLVTSNEIYVSPKIYTIIYEMGENILGTEIESETCTTMDTETTCSITLPDIYPEPGYSVSGWYNEDGTKIMSPNSEYVVSKDEVLTAKAVINSYTITYDYETNGGTSVSKEKETLTYNSPVDLTVTATKEGYTFLGWTPDKESTTPLENYQTPAGDITLYAIFVKKIEATFHYYNGNGVTHIVSTCSLYNNNTICNYIVPEEVVNSVGPNQSSYSGISKDVSSTIPIEPTTTESNYYAYYQETIMANYELGNNIEKISKENDTCISYKTTNGKEYISESCLITLPTITPKTGYTSVGWSTTKNDTTGIKENSKYSLNSNTTLYANAIDNENPIWNIESISTDNSQTIISQENTVTIKITGIDNTKEVTSTLTKENIKILVGETEIEPSIKTLTKNSSQETENYTLVLGNINMTGSLSISIDNGTLEDPSGNQNVQTSISTGINVVKNKVCKRATTLHTEECTQTDASNYCSGAGYTVSSSKKTTTITYGKLGVKGTLASGDAFDCDVNGDGIYDSSTERFYYVTDLDGNTAVLIYYNNVATGTANNQTTAAYTSNRNSYTYGPETAILQLPTTNQWNKVSLTNTTRKLTDEEGTVRKTEFSYNGYATRLLTVQELEKGCNVTALENKIGQLDNCNYLMENTKYSSDSMKSIGFWLESPYSGNSYSAFIIKIEERQINIAQTVTNTQYGVRPVMEIAKKDIDY